MASIKQRGDKFCVIYHYNDNNGKRRQKWETYSTKAEAKRRAKEIEYKAEMGLLSVPKCKTLKELLEEYIVLYGRDKWALATYERNIRLIRNYITPIIGDTKLKDINTRFMETFYQSLLKHPAFPNLATGKMDNGTVSTSTIRDIHKLLRNAFEQAVKWELMDKNPCIRATVPKHKSQKRDIWTAEQLMYAIEVCEDQFMKLALNLTFAASLRMGELLGLTWDCVDTSQEAMDEGRAYIYINKEKQRVSKEAIKELNGKDILLTFPEESKRCKTVRILKTPKTESSVRKVYIPRSVAMMLNEWRDNQNEIKKVLGEEYQDYGLVMATSYGLPASGSYLRKGLKKIIDENNLPPVVFHSLRHTSVTYKLKLNGGDIKAVQGDSGHSQVNMITDVYSHIIDEDRRKNAELFEDAFYGKKNLDPSMSAHMPGNMMQITEGVDAELLTKVLTNPEMAALLTSLAKSMQK